MAVLEKISKLVKNQFPDFYKEDGEGFLLFMQAYYEYMEQEGKLTHEVRNLSSYRDISTTTDDYITYFFNTLLPSVPEEVLADKKIMAKYIKEFNLSRGSLASYKLLFRTIYNESIELFYPSESILKVSDGDWRIDQYLVCSYQPATYNFIGKTIKGTSSQAEALVEDVVRRVVRGRDLMQILVSNVKGTFNHLEPIRLLSDTTSTGHTPIIEAGINNVTITSPGGEYRNGDVVRLISPDVGEFAKVVVIGTVDLGGTLTFSIEDGGSGYTTSTSNGGTTIELIGGDGNEPASFVIGQTGINDTFAISINTDLIQSNTVFGSMAPVITDADGAPRAMNTFANVIISATDYGFRESGTEVLGNRRYSDHANAVLVVANTSDPGITVGASLFGVTSGANATVTTIRRAYNSTNIVVGVDTYKNFTGTEKVNISTASGTTVGTVTSFTGNTAGWIPLSVAVISGQELSVGDEIRGRNSGAIGIVTHVGAANTGAYTAPSTVVRDVITYRVAANTSANLTSQFTAGPIKSFSHYEPIALVTANTTVGNVVDWSVTSNGIIENVYTKLEDAFNYLDTTFGTIRKLSSVVGGSGYSRAPTVRVRSNDVAALGIGESWITMTSTDSGLNLIDTSDRLHQTSAGAYGDIKQIFNKELLPDGVTYQVVARVWQDFGNRDPDSNQYALGAATLRRMAGSWIPGYETDTRTLDGTVNVTITAIDDKGVLGKNAIINAGVGANGTITAIRTLDSGFSYKQGEEVILEATNRPLATGGTGTINLSGVANAEGYYATTRSHVSTARGYIQDGEYYQEFSYEIISPISLQRYRDYALKLVHPAGQALFGKFRSQSNVYVDVTANTSFTKTLISNGTISITKTAANGTVAIENGNNYVVGTSTNFLGEFGNKAVAGSVEVTAANATVIGTGTSFTNYAVGDLLQVGDNDYVIKTIANNTVMSVRPDVNMKGASSNSNYTVNGKSSFIVEWDPGDGIPNRFVEVGFSANSATNVILTDNWIFGTITGANIYFANSHTIVGSSTTLTSEFVNGDVILIETAHKQYDKLVLNKVNSATSANLVSKWVRADLSGANAYYISGTF